MLYGHCCIVIVLMTARSCSSCGSLVWSKLPEVGIVQLCNNRFAESKREMQW